MNKLRIAVVHQIINSESPPDELDVQVQVETVCAILKESGLEVQAMPCSLDLSLITSSLKIWRADLVFNLVESLEGQCRLMSLFPARLDSIGMPYSGSKTETLCATTHKVFAKQYLRRAGIPTPSWIGPYPRDLSTVWEDKPHEEQNKVGCWIIKSLWEHASFGLHDEGVVRGDEVYLNRLLRERSPSLGGSCFAEEFIQGREFNLSILGGPFGPQILPPAEIVFNDYEPDRPRIVGYRAKWDPDSYEYNHTTRCFEFPEEDLDLLKQLKKIALQCWHLLDLRGYARIDFRVDEGKKPWVLEINANPCLSPEAGFAAALTQGGLSLRDALERIIVEAGQETS